MFGQKRCHNHAHAVVHEACLPQLPHARIDYRITGLSSLPRFQPFWIFVPRKKSEFGVECLIGHGGKMKQQVVTKLPPSDLTQKFVHSLAEVRIM